MKKYALGSPFAVPNGELENKEAVETPNMQTAIEIKGKSHEQGGVPANIPPGTEIYSDRLKIGDQTIAERKLARDKRLNQMMKAFDKNKTDLIGKKSLERTKQGNDFQDEKDLAFQEQAKKMIFDTVQKSLKQFGLGDDGQEVDENLPQYGWGKDKFGNRVWTNDDFPYYPAVINADRSYDMEMGFDPSQLMVDSGTRGISSASNPLPLASMKPNPTIPDVEKSKPMGFTTGDLVGTAGMAIGAFSQMANTIANARATKPVVNHYAGFNTKALQANAEYEDQIAYNKDIAQTGAERDLSLAENSARARLRNSASGIGTLRSLDIATDYGTNEAKIKSTNQLEGVFGQQKAQAQQQRVGLLSQQDQMEMSGQERADAANAANLDAFYTNFSQNIAGLSTGIENLGKNINEAKSRDFVTQLVSESNAWGVGVDPNTGKLTMQPNERSSKPYVPPVQKVTEAKVSDPLFNPFYDPSFNPFNSKINFKSKYS